MPIEWDSAVLFELIYCYSFALLTPLVLSVARKYHMDRPDRGTVIAAHVFLGLAISIWPGVAEIGLHYLYVAHVRATSPSEIQMAARRAWQSLAGGWITCYMTYLVVVSWAYAFDNHRKLRDRELKTSQLARRLAEAELTNLKSQLHPHFLFNTLHAIGVLMREDVESANQMLVQLSDLLRMTLQRSGEQETTLREELEFLERYLEIEQTRFADRLHVAIAADADTLDARVPSLVLQPLAENAIRHGLAPRAGRGTLKISARRNNGMVEIELKDDGLGLAVPAPAEGVGLSNTRARLEQLYGTQHQFEIANAPGGGVLVRLALPFRLEKDSWSRVSSS